MMRNALFLHIQKTAGTSIQEAARYAYGNGNVVSHGDYEALGINGCQRYPFVSGHFGFRFASRLMKEGRYSFTFLRDPIDRLVSLYVFCASQRSDATPLYAAARRTDLAGFLRLNAGPLRDRVWNNQTWQLASGYAGNESIGDYDSAHLLAVAKRNIERFHYVGFVETFDRDAANIWQALGIEGFRRTKSNVSSSKPAREDLPASTMDLLLENTALDRQLYTYAWRSIGVAGQIRQPTDHARHHAPA